MYLSKDMFAAYIDDRSVILDLKRDRYIGLSRSMTLAMANHLGWRQTDGDTMAADSAIATLRARGILDEAEAPNRAKPPPLPTQSHWPKVEGIHVSTRGGLGIFKALVDAQLALGTRPFHQTIDWLRQEKAGRASAEGRQAPGQVIDEFFALRPWFPVQPVCRLDAMALCLAFWRRGLEASLVFGVRLDPFFAHCWAQQGQVALKEAHDEIRTFTPIMAV